MFLTLFLKECKQTVKCLTYYVILICIFLFYSSQLGSEGIIHKPEPGQADYGFTQSDDKNVIMDETIKTLAREYAYNNYATYPVGFYKEVTLKEEKQSKLGEILAEVTGISKKELDSYLESYYGVKTFDSSKITPAPGTDTENVSIVVSETNSQSDINIAAVQGLTYERFLELMTKADKLLGGGSNYAKNKVKYNAYIPMTYEMALDEYNDIIEKDHLSGAYARYFCDYIGIVLAILPVFLAVTRGLRDKRARANEIIFSRQAPSWYIIVSRYLSMIVMLLIPVILLSVFLMAECIFYGAKEGISIDYFAFAKYLFVWLLPTLMITISVTMLITELTDTAVAILIQCFWWFVSLLTGNLSGNNGWNLIPRHNVLGEYGIFMENLNQFILNRITYTLAAILLLFVTVIIYEMKRKGRLKTREKIFTNRKSKSKA